MLLSLAKSDRTKKTVKSELFHVALPSSKVDDVNLEEMDHEIKCYILGLAAIIRGIVRPQDSFRQLAKKIYIIFRGNMMLST